MATATKKAGARKVPPVNGIEDAVKAAAKSKHTGPYPEGVATWSYQPKDESMAPIVLPLNGFVPGDKLWHFDLAQLPVLAQTWRWMDRANVPKNIQRQAQLLSDVEYFSMFNEWFDVMKAAVAPKGSVTAGK